MKGGKWIWRDGKRKVDEYVTFFDDFTFVDGRVNVDISVYGDYALYINGGLVSFGQYHDYATYKVYDCVDITPFVRLGKNDVKIIAWYIGKDFFTYRNQGRGLRYSIYTSGTVLAQSHSGTTCALSEEYVSYKEKTITNQLGFSYIYDTRNKSADLEQAVEVSGADTLVLRPNRKLCLKDYIQGKIINEKNRLYDLGKECSGFLKIFFRAAKGEKIKIAFGEHVQNGEVRFIIGERDFSVEVIGNGEKVEAFCVFRRLGCRYLQIYASDKTEIYSIGIVETEYPFIKKGADISNPLRRRIYDTSVRTLELCAHEHYEDCPWREQAMYIEDSRNQMLCGYYAFENSEFPRAAIILMLQGQREDGLFDICFPARCEFTIPSFSLIFPLIVLEYTQATKETEIAEKALPAIEKMLSFFLGNLQDNGLYKTVSNPGLWHFYEWSDGLDGDFFSEDETEKHRNCFDVLINAFLAVALKATEELCTVLGDFSKSDKYYKWRKNCNAAINALFLDERKNLYRTYENKDSYSALANALCVLCGAATMETGKVIAEKLAYGYDGWVRNTLSMNAFCFDAMLQVDEERFSPIILNLIDETYLKMLDAGATSFWETERGAADFDGAGSLCHGWSAIPVYYYHILGVTKQKAEKLTDAFVLRDNPMRMDYRNSIENYVRQNAAALKNEREINFHRSEKEKRERFLHILGEPLVGDFPKEIVLLRRERVLKSSEYVVERLIFQTLGNISFSGFLYRLPDDKVVKRRLIYCLHGGGGTPEIVGDLFHDSANYNHMVRRLLKRGTMVFAPQLWLWNPEKYGEAGDRERINRRLVQQGGSITALELFCLLRTLDWFMQQDYIDNERIGVVGLSYGGMYALHFGALDTRIKSVLSECWFNDRRLYNWHDWTYFGAEKYMLDSDLASIVLPRRLYIEIGKKDPIFLYEDAQEEKNRLLRFAEERGWGKLLTFAEFDGGHEFNPDDDVLNKFLQSF